MRHLIEQAIHILEGKVRKTPVEYSPKLSKLLGRPVYLKLECLQVTGSFKVRGGFFYLSTLNATERKRGVAACSAGNHGLGVAYAGKELRVSCTVFVPKSVDQAKYDKLVVILLLFNGHLKHIRNKQVILEILDGKGTKAIRQAV